LPAPIAALLWEAAEKHQAGDDEFGTAGEPGDVVGAEEFLNRREGIVDPARQGYGYMREDRFVGD